MMKTMIRGLNATAADYLAGIITAREACIALAAVVDHARGVRLRKQGVRIMQRLAKKPTNPAARLRRLQRACDRFARSAWLQQRALDRFKLMPWNDPTLND
jgi:hypothetical protein